MFTRSLLRRAALLLVLTMAMLAGFAAACTPVRHILVTADPLALGPAAKPDLFAHLPKDPAGRLEAWQADREDWLAALDSTLYGSPPPAPLSVEAGAELEIIASTEPGRRSIAPITITPASAAPITVQLALVLPQSDTTLRGVFLVASECGLQAALHDRAMPAPTGFTPGYCNAEGWLADMVGGFFGEWVAGPPAEMLLERGYAIAAWHESDIAPDGASQLSASLQRLNMDPHAPDRSGVISLWAWTMSRVADALDADDRFENVPYLLYGHSRRGKAVLLAAARDARFAVTIAHQAGTGGAALHGDGMGEPVASIVQSYPHWFVPAYADYAGDETALPVDQHALLALIAPRSVLLGAAWRDTWADPAGAFRAAQGASEAWAIYGQPGLAQTRMAAFDPSGGIASHIRAGTHGVTGEDWEAFLAFANAHTLAQRPAAP